MARHFVPAGLFVLLTSAWPACGEVLQLAHTTTALEAITPSATITTALKDGYFAQGDMPTVVYRGTTTSCSLNSGSGDGGYQIPATSGGCWIASPPVGGWPLDMWGPAANGTTDDAAKIQSALDQCHAAGGGKVLLGAHTYLVDSKNITIRGGCVLSASLWPGLQQGTGSYSSFVYTIVLNPAQTISNVSADVEASQGIENLFIISKTQYTAGPPTTYRAGLTDIANYSGTAITVSNGGQDFLIQNVTIVGFNQCVNIIYNSRPALDHVYGDCTNGLVASGIYDIAKWRDLEFFPALLNYGSTIPNNANDLGFTFTGVSNDSGQYCLTGVSTSTYLTPMSGDLVYVAGVGGSVGVNGKFTITVNGAGCNPGVLLVGSVVAPTPVATVTSGNQWIKLNSTPSQWVYWMGQTVSDSGGANVIPAGAVIDEAWIGNNMFHITKVPTGSSSSDTLSVSNPAYTSGGALYYTFQKRSGTGYNITNSTGVFCWNCFSYGYETGVHVGTAATAVLFSGGGSDTDPNLEDPTAIGILIDGTASGPSFIGFGIDSTGRSVVAQNTGNGNQTPNRFIGGNYYTAPIPGGQYGPSFELDSQWGNQLSSLPIAGNIEIADAVNSVQIGGLVGGVAQPVYQSATAQSKTYFDAKSIFQSGIQ